MTEKLYITKIAVVRSVHEAARPLRRKFQHRVDESRPVAHLLLGLLPLMEKAGEAGGMGAVQYGS